VWWVYSIAASRRSLSPFGAKSRWGLARDMTACAFLPHYLPAASQNTPPDVVCSIDVVPICVRRCTMSSVLL
jgi:hypothetical protein